MSDLETKITRACHRIEELYNETKGSCYISFSGGKDSTVLLALIKLCIDAYTLPEEGIKAIFSNTGIELGVTVDFVLWCKKNWYPNIEIIRPSKSADYVFKNVGKPISSKMKSRLLDRWYRGSRSGALVSLLTQGVSIGTGRKSSKSKLPAKYFHMLHDDFKIHASYKCCDYLKKQPFKEYTLNHNIKGCIVGLRMAEGGVREINAKARVSRGDGNLCTKVNNGVIYKWPIIDWTDEDIEDFIKLYNVPLSKAYTEFNFDRTGCMGCPYSQTLPQGLEYLYKYEPNRYKATMHWLKDVYIAQNVILPFDNEYEKERRQTWLHHYEPMRQEMLRKYRPDSTQIAEYQQLTIFDLLDEMEE